jgi:hypothetical protein
MGRPFKQLEPYNRRIRLYPLEIESDIQGSINNTGGYAAGNTELVVTGISALDSDSIKTGTYLYIGDMAIGAINNGTGYQAGDSVLTIDAISISESDLISRGSVVKIGNHIYTVFEKTETADAVTQIKLVSGLLEAVSDDDPVVFFDTRQPYRIGRVVKTGGLVTGLNIFPPLHSPVADAAVIYTGDRLRLDPGDLSEEVIKFTDSFGSAEKKNQGGLTKEMRIWKTDCDVEMTFIDNTVENNLFFNDHTAVVNAATGRHKIVKIDQGIMKGKAFKVEIVPDVPDEEIDYSDVTVLHRAFLSYETREYGTDKETFVKYPCKWKCTRAVGGNEVITFGDELITF